MPCYTELDRFSVPSSAYPTPSLKPLHAPLYLHFLHSCSIFLHPSHYPLTLQPSLCLSNFPTPPTSHSYPSLSLPTRLSLSLNPPPTFLLTPTPSLSVPHTPIFPVHQGPRSRVCHPSNRIRMPSTRRPLRCTPCPAASHTKRSRWSVGGWGWESGAC